MTCLVHCRRWLCKRPRALVGVMVLGLVLMAAFLILALVVVPRINHDDKVAVHADADDKTDVNDNEPGAYSHCNLNCNNQINSTK